MRPPPPAPRGFAMLTVLGRPRRCCDGTTRREVLRAGALSLFGSTVLAGPTPAARARSVILLDLFGGPSHLDSFDPKPAAPAEVRGEFAAIRTSVPGLPICEHLPRLSASM